VQDAAIQVAIDHLPCVGTEEAIFRCKALVIDLLQRFKIILNSLVVLAFLWFSGLVYGRGVGHERSLSKENPRVTDKEYCRLN
jgi:hypothetical protein